MTSPTTACSRRGSRKANRDHHAEQSRQRNCMTPGCGARSRGISMWSRTTTHHVVLLRGPRACSAPGRI